MNTIVGLFESRSKARQAKGALIRAHIASPNISLYDRSAAGSLRESEHSLWESLKDSSGFAQDRSFYEEGMRRGGTVLSVRSSDEQMNEAAEILSRHGALELDRQAEGSRTSGSSTDRDLSTDNEEATPAAREERQVGRREARLGKVRVYKRAA